MQIYPIDTAKSIYQRNCFTQHKDRTQKQKIQFFNPRMYKGKSSMHYTEVEYLLY